MRGPSPFSPAERKAIAAHISAINDRKYCHGVQTKAAIELCGDTKMFMQFADRPGDDVEPRLAPVVLACVAKLTTLPSSANASDVQPILDAGWEEDAVTHAVFVTALYSLVNRLEEGRGIKGSEAYYEERGKRLAETGYSGFPDITSISAHTVFYRRLSMVAFATRFGKDESIAAFFLVRVSMKILHPESATGVFSRFSRLELGVEVVFALGI